jgi:hypothetical protein
VSMGTRDIEDRLRAALRTRAGEFTVSDDAWRAVAGRPGSARRRAALLAGRAGIIVPLATAVAVIVIVVVAGPFVRYLARGNSPAPSPVAPARHWLVSPDAVVAAVHPAVTACRPVSGVEEAEVSTASGTVETYAWTCHPYPGATSGGLDHMAAVSWERPGTSGWAPRGWFYFTAGTSEHRGTGELAAIEDQEGHQAAQEDIGIADSQVMSVDAVLPGGQVQHGVMTAVPGFPDAVWVASYPTTRYAPSGEWSTMLLFRDAPGRVVARMPMMNGPAGSYGAVPGTVYAFRADPATGQATLVGVANGDVASVTAVLSDGRQVAGSLASQPASGSYRRWVMFYTDSRANVYIVTLEFRDSSGVVVTRVVFHSAGPPTP